MGAPVNPFKPATEIERFVKAFIYGPTGSGKTYSALHAPGRIAVIDSESGTDMFAGMEGVDFDVIHTKSYLEAIAALDYIEKHPGEYGTVVIDPVTILYDSLTDAAYKSVVARATKKAERERRIDFDPEGVTIDQPGWGRIKRSYKALMNKLLGLQCHVIVTAREKDNNVTKPNGDIERLGVKPDAEKSTAYNFDVVLHAQNNGRTRTMTVEKVRGVLAQYLPQGETYTDPTFDALFGEFLRSGQAKGKAKGPQPVRARRHVADDDAASSADASAVGNVRVASPDEAQALYDALVEAGYDPETVRSRRGWPAFTEMAAEQVNGAIAALKAKGEPPAPAPVEEQGAAA